MIDLGPDPSSIDDARPRLKPGVRLAFDSSREEWVLLGPESVRRLIGPASEVLTLCDGRRSIAEIAATLDAKYGEGFELIAADVAGFLRDLTEGAGESRPEAARERPTGLLAELTHRCPLHCEYCSNPPDPPTSRGELDQADWSRVLAESAGLGVLQVHFSGGEPCSAPTCRP